MKIFIRELWAFTWKESLCCIFPVIIFATLALSKVLPFHGAYRYDFILIVCILAQWALVKFGWESIDEVKVIMVFHMIGLGLELFKVHMGSWAYPEAALTKWWGVPLYSGFMYSSVASYVCQAWKRLHLRFMRWPRTWLAIVISIAIYANFFTHHYVIDLRWLLIAAIVAVFYRTRVEFTVTVRRYSMPMVLSFVLIAFFIWLAENISTFFGAWKYPDQMHVWQMVHWGKMTSWFMLVIISIIIVAELKRVKYPDRV
ncbi:DUF817 domain-containing protein [Paenibacillus whitsoniae]|uniref:DUF817 domain-containing protein n=1 Tax=Paenibacillus whitsoniae TaxID=2496558 RepID=A0A3S0A5V0_9BACL|nr:DUF817 domain-containing protein [Paenibacillus whitsoniae]RTE10308.1 DUF817 domain-containing protein [Paenibacillus whitsoniae]